MSETFDGVDAFAEARRDELDHAATLTKVIERLTCRTPVEATQAVCPPDFRGYCNGVKLAIAGENEAIKEYTELIELSRSRELDRILASIRADEEVHRAKFNKLYDILCAQPCTLPAVQDPCASYVPYWGCQY
jgi:rubrerythrin